jgi:hypothetical protein
MFVLRKTLDKSVGRLNDEIEGLNTKNEELKRQLDATEMLSAEAVKKTDELIWKLYAMMRINLINAAASTKDTIAVLSIEDEATFVQWVQQHDNTISPEARKFFGDILLQKDHKDPG